MEQLVTQQWLIPVIPAVAAAVQAFLPRGQRKLSATLTIGAMALACVFALRALFSTFGQHGGGEHAEAARAIFNFTWFEFGTTELSLGFILDPLTAGMSAMVTVVGLMIFINATGYMHDDENFTRFFCFLSMFAAAMLGLVVANNLLLLFMCWELVGLCSYLLIGFWYHKPSAAAAMKKAFITTRIGDVGFFIGILLLYWKTGTLNLYTEDGSGALQQANALGGVPWLWGLSLAGFIALMLFIGAMGKSAQFPLHVWLPDAMEGPTPVSALIHAATMVAAGVFMVGRMFPLFIANEADWVMQFVMWVGCITAVFSATIAVGQWDIKRVLAYSTCSQLGFMVMALGAGGLVAGQFHLLTHAFFKALLFLGSGCVIIGTHHEQDMRKMGGLKKYMPVTFWTYLIGMLALSGFPLTAGFFSKDEILLATFHKSKLAWGLATFAAFLTAFYMTRQMFLVFAGKWRGGEGESHGHHHEPHEVSWNMWLPVAVLSVFALFLGWVGTPMFFHNNRFHHYLDPTGHEFHHSNLVVALSIGVGLAGMFCGWLLYGRRKMEMATEPDPLQGMMGGLFTCLNRKWYIDEIYDATIVRLTGWLGILFKAVDRYIVDGILHGVAWLSVSVSQLIRWLGDDMIINGGFDAGCETVRQGGWGFGLIQSGRVQNYFRIMAVGLVILGVVYFHVAKKEPAAHPPSSVDVKEAAHAP
jgi:NADH-quinone oxidoreductase subunit L